VPRRRDVLVYPDERLRLVSKPVEDVAAVAGLIVDLVHTMYLHDAVGLAAPQVGEPVRIFVLDGAYFLRPGSDAIVVINPEIVASSPERMRRREGCLSFPGQFVHIRRPAWLVVRCLDAEGRPLEIDTSGDDLLSVAMLHEIDHLDGLLMPDRADERTRKKISRA
jgi:peptide deformylase